MSGLGLLPPADWTWLLAAAALAVAIALGLLAARIVTYGLTRLASRTATGRDDALVRRLEAPLRLAALAAAAHLLVRASPELVVAQPFVRIAVTAAGIAAATWAAWRCVDLLAAWLEEGAWGLGNASARSLLSLGVRLLKTAIVVFAGVTVLAWLGFPVATLLAGLGIGGLALALAAQKTVENLFGSLSLAVDQPFRIGDAIRIEGSDFVGEVEQIGLRSTRIRTLDRTLVTIPNGRLSDLRLESLTARDRLRLEAKLGLTYETTSSQVREVVAGIEARLRAHPKIWPRTVIARFGGFSDSSLDIDVVAWFETTDWLEFLAIREEMLIEFMEIIERAGSNFAFPTRTVHLVAPAGGGEARP